MIALRVRPARAITGFTLLAGTASLIFGLAFIQPSRHAWWLVFQKQATAIFCGSFAGMYCPITFSSWYCIGAAAVLSGIIFLLGKDLFNGVGGKLGTIAFGAVIAYSGVNRLVSRLQASLIRL